MKVDIHAHTERFSPDSRIATRELLAMAEAAGYDALFLTEHGKVWSAREIAGINEMTDRLHVLPGIQITLPDGQGVLVLGADNPVYESLRTPTEVFAQACADGFLTVLVPPFPGGVVSPQYFAAADAIETKSCSYPKEEHTIVPQGHAKTHQLSEVYGSDAYGLNYFNRLWIETLEPFTTAHEFRHVIVANRYENRTRETGESLPPTTKAAALTELSESDLNALSLPERPASSKF